MMTETGVVTGHEEGFARVEISRSAHCAMCSSKESCTQGSDAGPMVLLVEDPLGAPDGSTVEVGVPDGAVLRGALLVYALPLAVLVTALALTEALHGAQVIGVVGGIVGGGIAMWLGGRMSRRGACRPRLLRIVPPAAS
jgi:sigma-E factor negative regulatory protein RseC